MIGKLNFEKKDATIIGAGISGLLIGYHLKKLGFKIKIFEASPRVGGLIETVHTPFGISESAAHSLMISPELKFYFDELNIPLLPVNKKSKARFIFRDGKMRKMPLRFLEILKTLFYFFSKPKLKLPLNKLSLKEWGEAYLGKPATDYLLSPFVSGIFACTPEELNVSISFPKLLPLVTHKSLFQFLRSKKRKKNARSQMMVPELGMQSLVDRLYQELKSDILINAPIADLKEINSTNVIITTPASITAKLLNSLDPQSSRLLSEIKYSPLISVTAFYLDEHFLDQPPQGVGVLIPRNEGFRILGVLFNSSTFEKRANYPHVSLTIMMGGTTDPDIIFKSDSEITQMVNQEIRKLLNATESPTFIKINRWEKAIPIYSNSLAMAQASLADGFCSKPGNIIFNNFSKEVSIRGMIEILQQIKL